MRSPSQLWRWTFSLSLLLAGCGGSNTPENQPGDNPPAATDLGLKRVDAAKLPALAGHLNVGELEVAPPEGWLPKSRGKEYLAAFVEEKGAQIPSIVVKEVPVLDEFEQVDEENVVEFAKALQAELSKSIGKQLLEPARPMMIGEHAFARYVRGATISDRPAEVQVLTTIRHGHMYQVELRVRPDQIKKYRDQAYAVGAGLKFVDPPKPFEFKPAESSEPQKPAE